MRPPNVCDCVVSRRFPSMKLLLVAWLLSHHVATGQTASEYATSCRMCHTCDIPTKVDPCLNRCPRGPMTTVHHSAKAGPDTIRMEKLAGPQDLYEPVNFPHRAHAKMSEMSGKCAMCHHYNPPGRVLPCSDCHLSVSSTGTSDLSKPGLKGAYHRQCINCHRDWGGSIACEECHLAKSNTSALGVGSRISGGAGQAIRPGRLMIETGADEGRLVTFFHNEHTDLFGLACTDCHAQERCIDCHKSKAASVVAKIHVTQGHDRCSPCHTVEKNCGRCHAEQPQPGFSHARRTGFDLQPHHASLGCSRCHRDGKSYRGLTNDCLACHSEWKSGSFDHLVTGLKLDETHSAFECESCHLDHAFLKKPACGGCHDDKSYPDALPGTRVRSSQAKRL